MRIFVILFIVLMHHTIRAEVITTQAENFQHISSLYAQEITNPNETLLVFDIDDTLLTMSQDLGGVAWWNWQSDLLKNNPGSAQLFVKNKEDLVSIQNLLFRLIKMEVTDEFVIPFISQSINQGVSIMGLTARGSEHLSVTLTQLNDNGFNDVNGKSIFKQKGVKLKNEQTSSAGDFDCSSLSHPVTYSQGIMFLDGQNKGQALLCVLMSSLKQYRTIIFVDDVQSNLDAVEKVFNNREGIKVINILYTKEHKKENEFISNFSLQEKSYNQWQIIKNALKESIEHSNF